MTNNKNARIMLLSLCVLFLSFTSAAFAYADWDSVGVPSGNALMENVYRYEHGDPPSAPSYTPNYKGSSQSSGHSPSNDPSALKGEFYLYLFTGKTKKEFLEEFNKNTSPKAPIRSTKSAAKTHPNVKSGNKSKPVNTLPSIKEIQSTLRASLSNEMLAENDWKWVKDDDLDRVKVQLRERANSSQIVFREQNEPWYKDNPYVAQMVRGIDNENTFVWVPPIMEEHVRAFFKLKVSDQALRRLCEAQFITNYNVLHYKVFTSRLMQIQAKAKGADASALILAYVKELEAKAPKVFQEREAWHGEPFDASTIESRISNTQKKFTNPGWIFDPQILRDALYARFSRTQTTGQNTTLVAGFASLRGHIDVLLRNKGKTDINRSLLNYTHWLRTAKIRIPSTIEIWKES